MNQIVCFVSNPTRVKSVVKCQRVKASYLTSGKSYTTEFIPGFSEVRVAQYLVLNVVFCWIVYFLLPIVLYVLRFSASLVSSNFSYLTRERLSANFLNNRLIEQKLNLSVYKLL